MSTLTRPRDDGFDPIGLIQIVTEARAVGGKSAVWALAKRDARIYDAAAVVESCRSAERIAHLKAK